MSSTMFNLSVENEQADAGRDGRTRLEKPNSQVRTETAKRHFTFQANREQDRQPLGLIPSLLNVMATVSVVRMGWKEVRGLDSACESGRQRCPAV